MVAVDLPVTIDVYVARSKKFCGPYEKYTGNPVLHGGEGDYLSCGHGTVVKTPDGRMFLYVSCLFERRRILCRTPTCSAGNGDDSRPLGAL